MFRRPPISTRPDTPFPYPTLFRSPARLPPTPHRAPFTRLVPRLRLSDSAAIQRLSVDRRSQRRVDQPAIDHDRGADDVIAGAAGEVDRGPRHILRAADPPGGNPARHLVALIARGAVHLELGRASRRESVCQSD